MDDFGRTMIFCLQLIKDMNFDKSVKGNWKLILGLNKYLIREAVDRGQM